MQRFVHVRQYGRKFVRTHHIAVRLLILAALLLTPACSSDPMEEGEVLVTDLSVGDGDPIEIGHTLRVEYEGRLPDGTMFDSTEESGEEFIFTFGIGQVIEGWDVGLEGMREGGTRRLEIPSHMAFGQRGRCRSDGTCPVPPNTDVIYDVTVVAIFDDVLIEDEIIGDGLTAEPGDFLSVDFVGQLQNGDVFDSSLPMGVPFQFQVGAGSVIAGWDLGIPGMKEGGRRVITVPPSLAYGAYGSPPSIPQYAVLTFTIDLVEVFKNPNNTDG